MWDQQNTLPLLNYYAILFGKQNKIFGSERACSGIDSNEGWYERAFTSFTYNTHVETNDFDNRENPLVAASLTDHMECVRLLYNAGYRIRLAEEDSRAVKSSFEVSESSLYTRMSSLTGSPFTDDEEQDTLDPAKEYSNQDWNRVLVSLISWLGQLLSLFPCERLRPGCYFWDSVLNSSRSLS